jgi:hypothetical protein
MSAARPTAGPAAPPDPRTAQVQAARAAAVLAATQAGGAPGKILAAGHAGSLFVQLELAGLAPFTIAHVGYLLGAALVRAGWHEQDAIHDLIAQRAQRERRWGNEAAAFALEQVAAEVRLRWPSAEARHPFVSVTPSGAPTPASARVAPLPGEVARG